MSVAVAFCFYPFPWGAATWNLGSPPSGAAQNLLKTKLRRPKMFHVSWFHVSNISNIHKILKSSTWKEHEDASTANLHRFGCGVRLHDWRTSGRLMSKQRDHLRRSTHRGVTSWNEFTVQKVGIAKQSLLSSLGIGTPNEQICSFSLVIFHYLANESTRRRTSNLGVSVSTYQVTHLSTWFSRAPALLHWSSKRKPHKLKPFHGKNTLNTIRWIDINVINPQWYHIMLYLSI